MNIAQLPKAVKASQSLTNFAVRPSRHAMGRLGQIFLSSFITVTFSIIIFSTFYPGFWKKDEA